MALSFETRGERVLNESCKKFPDGSTEGSNHVLPPYYLTKHPETESDVNEAREAFDQQDEEYKKQKKNKKHGGILRGMAVNQTGDLAEREVYKLLYNCKVQKGYEFLSIHSFELDTKKQPRHQVQRPYESALRSELPSFPPNIPLNIELDFLVLVRNVGVIGIEVKSSSTSQNPKDNPLDKAEKQLTGGKKFLGALMSTVSGGSVLPYVRVICVPNDSTPSPSAKSHDGSYRLNSDIISQPQKFNSMLELFVKELIEQKAEATFTEPNFCSLTRNFGRLIFRSTIFIPTKIFTE